MSSPFSLQVDIFETGSCLIRWFYYHFCAFFDTRNPAMSILIVYDSMRYFMQLLLFTDSQI